MGDSLFCGSFFRELLGKVDKTVKRMANQKHVDIIMQGVNRWNEWRKEIPIDEKPDLQGANLCEINLRGANLSNVNFQDADLSGVNLQKTNLNGANLQSATLFEANLAFADLSPTTISGVISGMNTNLQKANLTRADLYKADLYLANFTKADLSYASLYEANLIQANLSHANITGCYLYGARINDWVIDGIHCDYIFWDDMFMSTKIYVARGQASEMTQWEREYRIPKVRDFRPGEFEELYKQLPTFEYYFERGFTPLDPLIMDQIVQAINEQHPEIELRLDSFHSRGQPHATFTVLHKDSIEEALKTITIGYETRLKVLEGQKEQLMQVVKMLGSGNVMLQPTNSGINLRHGVSPELTQQIIEFLVSLPGLDTENARRAWIYSVGLDASLQQQIQFSGASVQFFQLVVHTIIAYGRQTDGRLAIEAILAAVKQRVGTDRQRQCDRLIQLVQAEYQC